MEESSKSGCYAKAFDRRLSGRSTLRAGFTDSTGSSSDSSNIAEVAADQASSKLASCLSNAMGSLNETDTRLTLSQRREYFEEK